MSDGSSASRGLCGDVGEGVAAWVAAVAAVAGCRGGWGRRTGLCLSCILRCAASAAATEAAGADDDQVAGVGSRGSELL